MCGTYVEIIDHVCVVLALDVLPNERIHSIFRVLPALVKPLRIAVGNETRKIILFVNAGVSRVERRKSVDLFLIEFIAVGDKQIVEKFGIRTRNVLIFYVSFGSSVFTAAHRAGSAVSDATDVSRISIAVEGKTRLVNPSHILAV